MTGKMIDVASVAVYSAFRGQHLNFLSNPPTCLENSQSEMPILKLRGGALVPKYIETDSENLSSLLTVMRLLDFMMRHEEHEKKISFLLDQSHRKRCIK